MSAFGDPRDRPHRRQIEKAIAGAAVIQTYPNGKHSYARLVALPSGRKTPRG